MEANVWRSMDTKPFRAAFATLILVALSGCVAGPLASGSAQPSATAQPSPSATAQPSPSATAQASPSPGSTASPPIDGDQALVRIEMTGGFLPQEMLFTHYPLAVLYADGRLITQGATPEIYPGPALPSLVETRLSSDGVTSILEAARQAGLTGPDRQLGEPVPDAGQAVFTIYYPGGSTHRTVLYPQFGEPSPRPQVQALLDFESLVLNPRTTMPDQVIGADQPYAFDRLQVISRAGSRQDAPDPSLVTVKEWPLGSLATLGVPVARFGGGYRCVAISGSQLAALLPQVQQSNQLTLWRSEGALYSVIFHPLLPDDPDCPAF